MKSTSYSSNPAKVVQEVESRDLGPNSAGQSGDTQGLSTNEDDSSESVTELIEDGQYFEAGILSGIENAPLADEAEVRVRQLPDNDIPDEYLDSDEPSAR